MPGANPLPTTLKFDDLSTELPIPLLGRFIGKDVTTTTHSNNITYVTRHFSPFCLLSVVCNVSHILGEQSNKPGEVTLTFTSESEFGHGGEVIDHQQ